MQFRALTKLTPLALAISLPASAEIYIYHGPDGERLVSDRPIPGYALVGKRDSVLNVGHVLANRPIETGGPALFQSYIRTASARYGVDPALVEAVIKVESNFDPNAESHAGAQGLMQLMPKTAKQYQVRDRRDPRQNINAGVKHLSSLLARYNGNLNHALAAYNAGPTAVDRYNGVPPYPETRRYIEKVRSAHAQTRRAWFGEGS